MPTRYESHTILFDVLLGGPHALEVPSYQRSYSWEAEEITALWEDLRLNWSDDNGYLSDFGDPYFLGSIVTIPGAIGKRAVLLDGQQRLATITIMLCGIRDVLSNLGSVAASASASSLHGYLIQKTGAGGTDEFQLQLNREDNEFFRDAVQTFPRKIGIKPTLKSHRRIVRASQIAANQIASILKANPDVDSDLLDRLWRAIAGQIAVVNVTVTDEEEAGRIFEILNARGLELSLSDLLRNFLISQSEPGIRAEISRRWDDFIVKFVGVDFSPFLRHSWMSRRADISKKRAYKAIRDTVRKGDPGPATYIDELAHDSASYLTMINGANIARNNRRQSDLIWGFNVLRAKQALPLLIAIHQVCPDELTLSLQRINAITFRYGVIGKNPNEFEALYSALARRLRTERLSAQALRSELLRSLERQFPSDSQFSEELAIAQIDRTDMQRYVLWELERVIGAHKETAPNDPLSVNIEHVYPQGARETDENLEPMLSRLGNLALLSEALNKSMSNRPFLEKRSLYAHSIFRTTNTLTEYEDWNVQTIDARQRELACAAINVWAL